MPSTYLTIDGFQKLQSELEYLRKVKRQEIAAMLRDTNGGNENDGDPDPEYSIAKEKQGFIEGRIQDLEILLSNPIIIEQQEQNDVVDIGSKVMISENGKEPVSYTIVGPAEAAPVRGLISFASPLGSALIGHTVGDEVLIRAPGGVYPVHILDVS
jgi:transcription elongation factor GreA